MKNFLQGFAYQSRHALSGAVPSELGSLSLGYSYSDNTVKVYLTKRIGQKGVIDLNLSTFIEMWRKAIAKTEFTPELVTFFQNVSNELMPGFEYDIGLFNWFLRPHIQNTKIGFALIGTYAVSVLSDIMRLKALSENWCDSHPTIGTFASKRLTFTVPDIGDVICTLFISVGTSTRCVLLVSIKFSFDPSKLDSKSIDLISKKNMNMNRLENDNHDKKNMILTTESCQYRVPFLCFWTMFVSSILFKSRIKEKLSKL